MIIERLTDHRILDGLHFAWDTFESDMMSLYSDEVVERFRSFILYNKVLDLSKKNELAVFGVYNKRELCGVAALTNKGFIPFIFVKQEYRGKNAQLAKLIVQALEIFAIKSFHVQKMTVYATKETTFEFEALGFQTNGAKMNFGSMEFLEMERDGSNSKAARSQKNPNRPIFITIVIVVIILSLITGFAVNKMVKLAGDITPEQIEEQIVGNHPLDEIFGGSEDSKDQAEEITGEGLDAFVPYVVEDLEYEIVEESYTNSTKDSEGNVLTEFDVKYPKLQSDTMENLDVINNLLMDCAMISADTLYLNPSDAVKENMLGQKSPFIASQVTYKVTYAGPDFISVAFADNYYNGNKEAGFYDLRTRNIRLSDGMIFETADIVDLSTEFMHTWFAKAKEQAPDTNVLSDLYMTDFRKILGGEKLDNNYYDNFVVTADGVSIGMTYHYNAEQFSERGWVTALFSPEEVEPFKTDSELWKIVQFAY